jgi:ectoine hydroxylase-related dioxygenase (phytanoyl-CoA dioxygenase family)
MPPSTGRSGDRYILSDAQKAAFDRDGYVVLRQVLSPSELDQIEATFTRFIRGEVPGMGRDLCDMSGKYDKAFEDFSIINAMLPCFYEPSFADNVFRRICNSIAEQLIGADATYDYDQFLAKKPGKADAVFSMHQDLGYWPSGTPDDRTTTCSLALDDADESNGCLRVVPGTHREASLRPHKPLFADGDRNKSHILSVQLAPDEVEVLLPVRRGDVTIHNERIIHGSGGNSSERWRRTYVLAHRTRDCVAYERSIGFTHSHNDNIAWQTHLGAMEA